MGAALYAYILLDDTCASYSCTSGTGRLRSEIVNSLMHNHRFSHNILGVVTTTHTPFVSSLTYSNPTAHRLWLLSVAELFR